MLKRVLGQMQFGQEHTGGGCNAMTLYKDGHAIVVTIDAHTQFEHVSKDNPISVGIYRTVNEYQWMDENHVSYADAYTEADALTVVIDALDYVKQLESKWQERASNTLADLWDLMEKRHGLPSVSADMVNRSLVDDQYHKEIDAFITLWDALAGGEV